MRIRKIHWIICLLSLALFAISVAYYEYFSQFLNEDQYTNANGFTRLIIPDTFLYKAIIDDQLIFQSIFFSAVKNTIGPSFIWVIASNNWVFVAFINAVFVFFTLRYLVKIADELKLPVHKSYYLVFIIATLPTTLFFSVGALKEIPCLFGLVAFFYNYIMQKKNAYVFFFFFLILFRYQLAFPLVCFIIFDRFKEKSLFITLMFLTGLSFFFPLLKLEILSKDVVILFRESNGSEGSIGSIIENIRSSIPGLSVFAVLIRTIQSIFEPFFSFLRAPDFYDEGDINIYSLSQFLALIILFTYWIQFIIGIINVIRNAKLYKQNLIRLYSICSLIIIPTAGFSFIQHRYIYPITGLLILSAMCTSEKGKMVTLKTSKATPAISPSTI